MTSELLVDLTDDSDSSKRRREMLVEPVLGIIKGWVPDTDVATISIEPDRFKQDDPIARGVMWWMLDDDGRETDRPNQVAQRVYDTRTLFSTSQIGPVTRANALAVGFQRALCEALADELSTTILHSIESDISKRAYDLLYGVITSLLLEFLPSDDCLEIILAEVPTARAVCESLELASSGIDTYRLSTDLSVSCEFRARYKMKRKIKRGGEKRKESMSILVTAESDLQKLTKAQKGGEIATIAMMILKIVATLLLII